MKAVLTGLLSDIFSAEQQSGEESLDELEQLLTTAGGECVGRVLQKRHKPDPRTLVGKGKLEEIKNTLLMEQGDTVIFDNDLSPSQTKNLAKELDCPVLDRSALILDIFADRAQTREGRLQVELARYQYMLPRLTGMWTHLDRETASGGGTPMGTRGTGETQLETDRRIIRRKIERLEKDLKQVRKNRATQRSRRQKNDVPLVAMVGYTNAGKSSLMNALAHAGIHAEDRLFDTLDTTTRRLYLGDYRSVLLSDTVGFIRRLPHHLVESFKATLEELSYADIILHIIDCSDEEREIKTAVTLNLIKELCDESTPVLSVYNKCDLLSPEQLEIFSYEPDSIVVSAAEGRGLDKLKERIKALL